MPPHATMDHLKRTTHRRIILHHRIHIIQSTCRQPTIQHTHEIPTAHTIEIVPRTPGLKQPRRFLSWAK